jgi:hypothetical protein
MSITVRDLRVAEARWREVQTNVDTIGQALRAWDHRHRNQLANIGRADTITQTIGRALDARAKLASDTIGQALDARAKMASDTIGQALNVWDRSYGAQLAEVIHSWNRGYSAQLNGLANIQLQSAAIGQVLDAWNHGVVNQLADLVPTFGLAAEAAATDMRRTYQTLGLAGEAIRTYRQLQQMTERHSAGMAVGPREMVPPTDALVGIAPSGVDWPPLGRFTLRVLLATVTLALIIVVWEEGREDAPAVTLAVIYGLVAAWQQFDEAMCKDS